MKINNRKELQNIAINHSADIDYKDFIKIYREYTKEPFNFLTIDTTLNASNPLKFRKKLQKQKNCLRKLKKKKMIWFWKICLCKNWWDYF